MLCDFDYIIIGAGSAGCVLADKLTVSGKNTVLLIEAGPSDNKFWIKTPIGYGITFTDRSINWCYNTLPEKNLNNRIIYMPRGKVLGGSSSINALVYHRGQSKDYNDWEVEGNPGWDYNSLIQYFNSFEFIKNTEDKTEKNFNQNLLSINNAWEDYHPIKKNFLDCCMQAQITSSKFGYIEGEGIGPYSITTKNGKRCSSSDSFLKPSVKRTNLKVLTNTIVKKILIKKELAVGVELTRNSWLQKKETLIMNAKKEVVLCAGAINSPQLLQLSGIGERQLLEQHQINVVLDQPNVGMNLQDHLGINYYSKASIPTLNDVLGNWNGLLKSGIEYIFKGTGPLSLGVNQIGGLAKSSASENDADMQLYLNPVSYSIRQGNVRKLTKPDKFSGFFLSFNSCRPYSRGQVKIQSSDPQIPPKILCNYLSEKKDIEDIIKGASLISRMQETEAIKGILKESPFTQLRKMTDDEIIYDFKNRAGTVFHPCGTCRMGPDPRTSVVDPKLKVHNIDNLRVVDASIFPNITSANTNAPTIMVAHKAADMMLDS